jgi:hypothetical protein
VIWTLTVAVVAVVLVLAVCSAALVEVFRQLGEIRDALNLRDEPIPLSLKSGELTTTAIGLPSIVAAEPRAIVIFLSSKCATCLAVAEAFRGGSPATVWFVLQTTPPPATLLEMLAESSERIVFDDGELIATRLGLNVTPSVLSVSYGEISRAQAVSSARQVLAMIPTVFPRHPTAATLPPYQAPSEQHA